MKERLSRFISNRWFWLAAGLLAVAVYESTSRLRSGLVEKVPAIYPSMNVTLLDAYRREFLEMKWLRAYERENRGYVDANHGKAIAQDGQMAVFLNSGKGDYRFMGFHNLVLTMVANSQNETILSLWEADIGSGASFCYGWSKDSKAIYLLGESKGFSWDISWDKESYRNLNFIYLVDEKKWYDVGLTLDAARAKQSELGSNFFALRNSTTNSPGKSNRP